MIKRTLIALALLAATLISTSAPAMCTTGYVGIDKGRPRVELPQCETHPR